MSDAPATPDAERELVHIVLSVKDAPQEAKERVTVASNVALGALAALTKRDFSTAEAITMLIQSTWMIAYFIDADASRALIDALADNMAHTAPGKGPHEPSAKRVAEAMQRIEEAAEKQRAAYQQQREAHAEKAAPEDASA